MKTDNGSGNGNSEITNWIIVEQKEWQKTQRRMRATFQNIIPSSLLSFWGGLLILVLVWYGAITQQMFASRQLRNHALTTNTETSSGTELESLRPGKEHSQKESRDLIGYSPTDVIYDEEA